MQKDHNITTSVIFATTKHIRKSGMNTVLNTMLVIMSGKRKRYGQNREITTSPIVKR